MKAVSTSFLALADGSVFYGQPFGVREDRPGEVVFNTGMTGYQEIITDPSYAGQFVVLTVPEVGNYGCNAEDDESRAVFMNGLVVRELNEPSSWRATESLESYMLRHGSGGISGIDTRRLTLLLRDKGPQKAWLHVSSDPMTPQEAIEKACAWEGLDGQDYASRVSTTESYRYIPPVEKEGRRVLKIAAFDFGIKYNILRCMAAEGMDVTVLPARTRAADILAAKFDGVFLSNGPADPAAVIYAQDTIRELLGKLPVFGICLGHQLLAIACGAHTVRLPFGHHGCNHPVLNKDTGEVEITSQNHNYTVSPEGFPDCLQISHVNLNDGTIEGLRHKRFPAFSVQYHPEAAPGPHDSRYLFSQFRHLVECAQEGAF